MADPASPLGYDMKYGEDLDPGSRSCSGEELVEDGMLHRLMADTLPMIGAPGGVVAFGVNVRRWVGEVTTESKADAKRPEIAMVMARDDRLDPGTIDVQITIAARDPHYDLFITVDAYTLAGSRVGVAVGVSRLTVDLLAQQGLAA